MFSVCKTLVVFSDIECLVRIKQWKIGIIKWEKKRKKQGIGFKKSLSSYFQTLDWMKLKILEKIVK